ncbi:DUF1127 domain-containing protein [Gynuella sp.]|uniref:DUF1127 domain-containing protein n=1 Tax=Gynuella sp. TaxID=2969146 RepID=UPI003D0CF8BA
MSTLKILVPALHVHAGEWHFSLQTLKLWNLRYKTRQQLKDLSPHLLRDIGLTAYEANAEVHKPFWKG